MEKAEVDYGGKKNRDHGVTGIEITPNKQNVTCIWKGTCQEGTFYKLNWRGHADPCSEALQLNSMLFCLVEPKANDTWLSFEHHCDKISFDLYNDYFPSVFQVKQKEVTLEASSCVSAAQEVMH